MTTWKKVLIVALCIFAVAAFVFVALLCGVYYEKKFKVDYWESWTDYVSPTIVLVHGYKGVKGFEQLKDIRTGKYTTPRLNHIFVNSYNSEDSLVVFRTHDRKRGYVNINTGKIVIPAQYQRAWNFSEGIAAVYKDGLVSFINESGQLALPVTFPIRYELNFDEIAFQFHNGLCVMRTMDNKWGLINTQGEWVVEPVYNTIDAPFHSYRRVYDDTHCGLIDANGHFVLPVVYDEIRYASDGKGWILVKDGLASEVDFQLQVLVPFVHDGIHVLSYVDDYREYFDSNTESFKPLRSQNPRFFRFDIGINSGVIDDKGRVIIPAIYYNVHLVNDNLFEVEVTGSGERLLYNSNGRLVK